MNPNNGDEKKEEQLIKQDIIFSEAGLEIVINPFLVGDELSKLAEKSSGDFLKFIKADTLPKPIGCLNILRGGRYYHLMEAWQSCYKNNDLNLCEIRAARSQNAQTKEWECKVWFDKSVATKNFSEKDSMNNLIKCNTLLIGDTIATGTTLINVLKWVAKVRKEALKLKNDKLTIIIFSIAGSSIVRSNLSKIANDLLSNYNIKIELVLANIAFNLDDNGTDLAFVLNNNNEINNDSQKWIDNKIDKKFLKYMKCAVWDWGDRFDKDEIPKHLKEVSEYFVNLTKDEQVKKIMPKHILDAAVSTHKL